MPVGELAKGFEKEAVLECLGLKSAKIQEIFPDSLYICLTKQRDLAYSL